jgi:hypothetical protein
MNSATIGDKALENRLMDQRQFTLIAGVIFAVVALVHLVRIYTGWTVMIGNWSAPMWVSGIAVIVAGSLSYFGLRTRH